ncbi:formate dehydrogenase accessory protein FdhE [Mesosutterella sp. AGMB02718]|uniref:Formate dehydrogenase accessory protein FdhE n=1 Tax=Mesosutterella faecium TaxID=2925194 RepID=A0ABT7IM90_9BURK|nr:formate dehydrogenase accessory protein FdhE [Mesosutterella sp. AGMB02718]MDL2058442.1 formate dehydrogenase accessory protein FdhE [Mesosutterella sp. AGMB02718]
MLNAKKIEKAVTHYASHKDESVRANLRAFAPALLKAAELRARLDRPVPEWSDQEIKSAALGRASLLSARAPEIDPGQFLEAAGEIAAALRGGLGPQESGALEAVDFSAYADASALQLAARDPMAWLAEVEEKAAGLPALDSYVLPVLGLTLRVFLEAAADAASRRIDPLIRDYAHHNRPLRCPVCGSEAAVACVAETQSNGSVKRLFCTCCGADWLFERIRCAHCGTQVVSDLSYVHDEADQEHRLHLCRHCGSAFPTVFAKDSERFSPEVEEIVMSGLEAFYAGQSGR